MAHNIWKDELSASLCVDMSSCNSAASTLAALFKGIGVIGENVHISNESVVRIGGSEKIYNLLKDIELFITLPVPIKIGIMDILSAILSSSIYSVSRFRCCESPSFSLVEILLKIMCMKDESVVVKKRILRVIGISAACGITPPELKLFFEQLKYPSQLSISLLQTLKLMTSIDDGVVKASPAAFFNFGGDERALRITPGNSPFQKEYQMFMWFRIERFGENKGSAVDQQQHLVTCMDGNVGVDIFINSKHIAVRLCYGSSEESIITCNDFELSCAVWYHVCITHTKPRLAIFAKYELSVHIDGQVVFQGPARFPQTSSGDLVLRDASIGDRFDGQMGPIHIMSEVLHQSTVQLIARQNAGKSCEGIMLPWSAPDLLNSIVTPDRKVVTLASKFGIVYHPLRHVEGSAIDVHSSLHAVMSQSTKPWQLHSVRDVIMSLGGISCVLPLFPKLLIENAHMRSESTAVSKQDSGDLDGMYNGGERGAPTLIDHGLGSPLGEDLMDDSILRNYSADMVRILTADIDELQENRPIALLLSILARCIRLHKLNQEDLLSKGGIEMIEYALLGLPNEAISLKREGESCILAILELRSAAHDHPLLEAKITRTILCNIDIWACASYKLQSSLFSVIVANIQAQPDLFMQIVGVQRLLTYMVAYYLNIREDVLSELPGPPISPQNLSLSSSDQFQHEGIPRAERRHSDSHEGDLTTANKTELKRRKSLGKDAESSFRRAVTRRMSQIEPVTVISPDHEHAHETVSPSSGTYGESFPIQRKWGFGKAREMSCHFDSSCGFLVTDEENECDDNEEGDPRENYIRSRLGVVESMSDTENGEGEAIDDPQGEDNTTVTSLDNTQRKALRLEIQSMIMIMVGRGCGVDDVRPLLLFLSSSDDEVVIEEMCQLLLCVIVKGNGRKIVTTLAEICKGTEEFGAFLIHRFFNHTYEKLRCTSAALLMHFYIRVDTIPPSVLNSYSKKKKGSLFTKAREKFSSMIDGQGMERLNACGGLAFICRVFDEHSRKSTEDTYVSFLDLLLISPDTDRQISPVYRNMYVEMCQGSASPAKLSVGIRSPGLVDALHINESTEIIHPCALPAFFYILPKLPFGVQERVFLDLLALIKHSASNRDMICSDPRWHISLFELVGQLMAVSAESVSLLNQRDFKDFLRSWAIYENPGSEDTLTMLFSEPMPPNSPILSPINFSRHRAITPPPSAISTLTSNAHRRMSIEKLSAEPVGALDMWFAIGMKIYGTLLLHSLDYKWGSREMDKLISYSYDNTHGVAVSLAVFSHMLNEFTFSMQAKYKDMQRMAKSNSGEDNNEATVMLENMLSIIYTLSIYLLEEQLVAGLGVVGLNLGRRRLDLLANVRKADARTCRWTCSKEDHSSCLECPDPCPTCKHSLALHPKRKMSLDVVEDTLQLELAGKTGLEGDTSTNHVWLDIRKNSGRPPTEENHLMLMQRTPSRRQSLNDDVFNPLERGYEFPRGRMVVILQTLRFFDMIFWPSEGRLRNSHLMYFVPKKQTADAVPKTSNPSALPRMTLCSTTLRMCLYVLNQLSPFSELADLNIRRMQQLIRTLEKLPPGYPAADWPFVILTHVVMALRRIHMSLRSVYDTLGVVWSDELLIDGSVVADDRRTDEVEGEIAFTTDDPDIVQRVNGIFNSTPGKQIMTYITSLVDLLTVLYESQKNLLASALGDKSFLALTLLVQKNQNAQNRLARSGSVLDRQGSSAGEGATDSPTGEASTRSRTISKIDSMSDSDSLPRHRSTSLDEEDGLAFCQEVVKVFRWLNEPFLKFDLLRNERIIKSIISIETFEKKNVKMYFDDMKSTKDGLTESKDIVNDYKDEVNELSELGIEVAKKLAEEEENRVLQSGVTYDMTLKASAMYWNNCLRDFEESWSPWSSDIDGGGEPQYVISAHRDWSLRRVLTRRADDPADHSDAAYMEGKARDQMEHDGLASTSAIAVAEESVVEVNSFLKNTLQFTRPKMSKLQSQSNWEGSQASDEEDAEEKSINVTSKPESKSFALFGAQTDKSRPLWTMQFQWHPDERIIFTADVNEIMLEQALNGSLVLTNKYLYFHPKKRVGGFAVKPDAFRNRRWKLDRLTECYGRRYLLQNCGIEMFFADCPEIFLAFNSTHDVLRFFRLLRKQHVPSLMTGGSLSPIQIFQHSPWTELWRRRMISNFEYIMRLNVMAGRSYNDITQYPVMPWVLANFEAETIDINDPSIYRDLSKPIGALNESRLVEILDRYKSFGDSDMPSFMYGSHYSSSGIVMHFLIRQETFTTMAITLQGGRFDCPDRLFFNIKETWKCCNTSMSDVKELIPECYYLPEMFVNTNRLPLGELQDDRGDVDDVILPPWCNGDPFEFVRLHRAALESDYVSEHLSEWIDLVFGYKQTGQAAIDACNLFHYLTYENAIDIESIEDPLQRSAMKAQVTHFGQTPSQLILNKEHPKRLPKEDCMISFCATADPESLSKAYCYFPPKQHVFNGEHGAIVSLQCSSDRLVACYSDFTIAYYRWNAFPDTESIPFQLKQDRIKTLPSASYSSTRRISVSTFDDDMYLDSSTSRPASMNRVLSAKKGYFEGLFSMTKDKRSSSEPVELQLTAPGADSLQMDTTTNTEGGVVADTEFANVLISSGNCILTPEHVAMRVSEAGVERILTCGYWDFSLKCHSLDSMREVCSIGSGHVGAITCIEMGTDKHFVVTGSSDCTCRVWILENPTIAAALVDRRDGPSFVDSGFMDALVCVHVLWGHISPISAIAYSHHHDLVFSGSENGLLCVHTARRGRYVRSIREYTAGGGHGKGCRIDGVGVSTAGYLVAHSRQDLSICVFWINGQLLNRVSTISSITCMTISTSGQVVFCGSKNGIITVRRVWDLEGIHTFDTSAHGAVTSMTLVAGDQFLLIGSEDGTLKVCTDPDARWKTLHTAIQKNPLMGSAI